MSTTISSVSAPTSFSTIIQPNDVLFGRGGGTNQHIGNQRFRELVAEQMPAYLRALKKDKIVIARHIVSIIQSEGGRFLRRSSDATKATTTTTTGSTSSSVEDDCWIPVTDQRAREKTSQALREGLDVRNRTFRTDHKKGPMARRSLMKQQQGDKTLGDGAARDCLSSSSTAGTNEENNDHNNPRTRPRLVTGVVLLPKDTVTRKDPVAMSTMHHIRKYDPYSSDDAGTSSAGGVPDLLEEEQYEQHEEQFEDAPEEYGPTSTIPRGGSAGRRQHHLDPLFVQFEPPRTGMPITYKFSSPRATTILSSPHKNMAVV